jgi:hypothetical protein
MYSPGPTNPSTFVALPIHLTKHQIHGSNDSHRIRQQMPPRNLIEARQVGKARRPDFTPIRPLATVRNEEDAHLALGRFDSAVGFAGRHGVALAEEQEMVDQCLHVLLHGGARRGCDLVVFDLDRAGGHLIQALVDNAEGLAELLHAAEVAVIAVAVHADGHVEFDLVVGVVGLRLADVPGNARSAQHDAREGVVDGIGGGDDAHTLCTSDPNAVVSQHLLGFVDTVAELSGPLVDVVEHTERHVLANTARADVRSVETGTRDTLVELLHNLSATSAVVVDRYDVP